VLPRRAIDQPDPARCARDRRANVRQDRGHHHRVERIEHEKHVLIRLDDIGGHVAMDQVDVRQQPGCAEEGPDIPVRRFVQRRRELDADDPSKAVQRRDHQRTASAGTKIDKDSVRRQLEHFQQRPERPRPGRVVATGMNQVLTGGPELVPVHLFAGARAVAPVKRHVGHRACRHLHGVQQAALANVRERPGQWSHARVPFNAARSGAVYRDQHSRVPTDMHRDRTWRRLRLGWRRAAPVAYCTIVTEMNALPLDD